jgi:hypothetical protein
MSGIPSDIAGSSLQAGFAQREAARATDSAKAGQAQATERQLRAVDEAATNVETTDSDMQIFADAQGAGGKGREPNEENEEQPETEQDSEESLDTGGSPPRLDIQA